jgi:exodeoxyribonuclease VII large subunit
MATMNVDNTLVQREISALDTRDAVSTVSELIGQARVALERAIALQWVTGEISGFKRAASGHCYFDLKDAQAQVACVLYRNRAALISFELRDGVQAELRLRPSIYEPRGSLQFTVEQGRLAGVGRLYEAFLRLKAKLESEGLFDAATKRALPDSPRAVGLITSQKAAALADMLRVLRDRWPRAKVVLYPASVQGSAAPGELLAALNAANVRRECDVLIIGRGGGSIEDLWAFNDEALVRAVAASALPIVSAVGHETDFTLCDFAADVRAATPTAAANLVVPERREALARIERLGVNLASVVARRIDNLAQRIDRAHERLRASDRALMPWRVRMLQLQNRLHRAMGQRTIEQRGALRAIEQRLARDVRSGAVAERARQRLSAIADQLRRATRTQLSQHHLALADRRRSIELLNPQHVLDRGYAVVLDDEGRAITESDKVKPGAAITARLKSGELLANVIATRDASEPLDG